MGTVWTWLLGPYFDAVAAVEGAEAARAELAAILPDLRRHLADAGPRHNQRDLRWRRSPRPRRLHSPGMERSRNTAGCH